MWIDIAHNPPYFEPGPNWPRETGLKDMGSMRFAKCIFLSVMLCGFAAHAQDSLHVRALGWLPRWGEDPFSHLSQITVEDTVMAVNADGWGLKLLDIADVWHPAEVSTINEYVGGMTARDHYLYVISTWFKIFDISNLQTPVQVSGFPCCWEFMNNLTVAGDYAYACDQLGPVSVFHVADPANPTLVSAFGDGETYDIEVVAPYAYITYLGGLQVVDISNLEDPVTVGYWWADYASPVDLELAGNYAYMADGEGVPIVDISNPSSPTLVHYMDTPGVAYAVDVVSHFMFVAQGTDGLQIYDITDPANPEPVGDYDTPGAAMGVKVHGTVAYVADDTAIRLYDVSYFVSGGVPRAPREVTVHYSPDQQFIRLSWSPVYLDTSDVPLLLDHYSVWRATNLNLEDWEDIGTPTPPDTTVFVDSSAIGAHGFYHVRAVAE
jgi:hypothetical protein